MTTPISTSQASDPWEMALIHSLIRRGFEQAREAVLAPGAPARADAVAEYVHFHLDGLEAHHSSEDELIWPVLHERATMSDALIRRMEDQHAGLHDALDTTRRELAGWLVAPTADRVGSTGNGSRHRGRPAVRPPRRGGARRRAADRRPHHPSMSGTTWGKSHSASSRRSSASSRWARCSPRRVPPRPPGCWPGYPHRSRSSGGWSADGATSCSWPRFVVRPEFKRLVAPAGLRAQAEDGTLFAASAVSVAIQVGAISRVAGMDRVSAVGADGVTVLVVHPTRAVHWTAAIRGRRGPARLVHGHR